MSWKVEISKRARKNLRKIGHVAASEIIHFLETKVQGSEDPRLSGKALKGDLGEYWRYRVGNYRILCDIIDDTFVVLVIDVDHRKNIYRP